MIRTMLYRPATGQTLTGAEELLDVWRQEPDTIVWADFFDHPPQAERERLVDGFGLHPLAVQDAQRTRHPPKVEVFCGHEPCNYRRSGKKLLILRKAPQLKAPH